MCTPDIASDVPKEAHALDIQVTMLRRGISCLVARLRAAVALINRRDPCQGALRPNQSPLEMNSIARLARDHPTIFLHLF